MAACPNCGRQTLRTKDWACQWCGYPLISRAYKKIDKTFKELQEERSLASKSAETEIEPELEPEPEPAPEPEPRPIFRHVTSPEPAPSPKPEAELKSSPPLKPIARPEPEIKPEPAIKSLPEPVNIPEQKPAVIPPAPPIILPSSVAPPTASQAQAEPEPPSPKPEIKIEPEPPPEPPINLDSIHDGMEITADQLDTLYRADKSGAHAKFTGKTLVIRGLVEKVFIREHLEIRYIVLTASGKKALWSIRCTFNKADSLKASRLNEGEAVTVRGKYDGYSKNIIFKDCVIV